MSFLRLRFPLLAVAVALVVASCGDAAPTAPSAPQATLAPTDSAPILGRIYRGLEGTLLSCSALPAASNSKTIGPAGGVLNVGPHRLIVPAGARQRRHHHGDCAIEQHAPRGIRAARAAVRARRDASDEL